MKQWKIVFVIFLLSVSSAAWAMADECLEGDCDNGTGTGYTDDNKIYEGEWQDGMPHGRGKLYVGKGKVVEGVWENGTLIKEEKAHGEGEAKGE